MSAGWYYKTETGVVIGPTSLSDLRQLVTIGRLEESTPIRQGMGDWQTAAEVPGLFDLTTEDEVPRVIATRTPPRLPPADSAGQSSARLLRTAPVSESSTRLPRPKPGESSTRLPRTAPASEPLTRLPKPKPGESSTRLPRTVADEDSSVRLGDEAPAVSKKVPIIPRTPAVPKTQATPRSPAMSSPAPASGVDYRSLFFVTLGALILVTCAFILTVVLLLMNWPEVTTAPKNNETKRFAIAEPEPLQVEPTQPVSPIPPATPTQPVEVRPQPVTSPKTQANPSNRLQTDQERREAEKRLQRQRFAFEDAQRAILGPWGVSDLSPEENLRLGIKLLQEHLAGDEAHQHPAARSLLAHAQIVLDPANTAKIARQLTADEQKRLVNPQLPAIAIARTQLTELDGELDTRFRKFSDTHVEIRGVNYPESKAGISSLEVALHSALVRHVQQWFEQQARERVADPPKNVTTVFHDILKTTDRDALTKELAKLAGKHFFVEGTVGHTEGNIKRLKGSPYCVISVGFNEMGFAAMFVESLESTKFCFVGKGRLVSGLQELRNQPWPARVHFRLLAESPRTACIDKIELFDTTDLRGVPRRVLEP